MKWQNTEQYEWLQALSAHGLAWEFLRRNRAYRSAAANLGVTWPPDGSPPDETWSAGDQMSEAREWGLLLFETPDRDAREANIFWMPEFCPSVLPVVASQNVGHVSGRFLNLSRLRCRNVLIPGEDIQHLLCADQGRFLQLSVTGECLTRPVQVLANVLPMTPYSETRWRGFRRLNDLVCTETLRTKFYPPDLGARRLSRVLQALDGYLAGASQREVAVALFGAERVEADWRDPRNHLCDQVRRAIRRGRDLMNGGYLKLLR
ncbi:MULTISPECIES: DUF2285 domain-containing protein [Alphaproteobacteria]|jgi:hypothetical protein|uniref:DUF2285 domain-containing protein n=2 Tax=Pseudomonadota TaxID=1224 RepID=UPI0025FDF732|nr:DUF2285 domain-containing protein [Parvibaculum sp.]